jgi:hypothetical protein
VYLLSLLSAAVELGLGLLLLIAALELLKRARWAMAVDVLDAAPPPAARGPSPPFVTVQLPLRNEPQVAEGVLRAAAGLTWPRDRIELQVLDDSDDETPAIVDRVATVLRADGHGIDVLRRADRRGYKAGALALGLARARGERILVLDADFRPEPDLLARLDAALGADEDLAFCQARWSYRNREASTLTRLQAAILDALFAIEQAVLTARGAAVQFNGTAGLWRREAITRAGGWATGDDALTEDLDLSFRAHEVGLRGATLPELAVSTELPEDVRAWRAQQARWVRGAGLTLRTLGHRLLHGRGGAATLLGHLLRHARQPLFVAAALRLPVVAWLGVVPVCPPAASPAIFALALLAAAGYLGAAERRVGRSFVDGARLAPGLFLLSVGLAPTLSLAFVGGVLGRAPGGFVRTAKRGDHASAPRAGGEPSWPTLALGAVALVALVGFAHSGDWVGLSASAFVALGCLWIGR